MFSWTFALVLMITDFISAFFWLYFTFKSELTNCYIFTALSHAENVQKFKFLKKNVHLVLAASLERAIWNWMDHYPEEFTELQKKPNDELAGTPSRSLKKHQHLCTQPLRTECFKHTVLAWKLDSIYAQVSHFFGFAFSRTVLCFISVSSLVMP